MQYTDTYNENIVSFVQADELWSYDKEKNDAIFISHSLASEDVAVLKKMITDRTNITNFYDFKPEDFELVDYKSTKLSTRFDVAV